MRATMAGVAVVALGLSACASDNAEYETIDELVDAYHEAGGQCHDFVVYEESSEEAQIARCGFDTVLTVTDSDDVTSDVATSAMLRGETVLVGPGWIVEDPETVTLRENLGGSLLALQEGPAPEGVDDGAFIFGTGGPRIQVVVDPQCDYCNRFIEANGDELIELADSGEATVEYYVVAWNDEPENNFGSSYGLNALACAADSNPDAVRPLLAALLQGSDEGAWTEAALTDAATSAGADVADCIAQGQFLYWGMETTSQVRLEGLPDGSNVGGVPYILIDGVEYSNDVSDSDAFSDAVGDAR